MVIYKQLERYHNEKVIRAALYSRCSSDEQKKNGYTITDQLDLLTDFTSEYGLVTAGTYVDEGISATLEISKRKDLARLIEDAKKGKFDVVIFKCIDRFFRNVGEYYECQKQLSKAGVTWVSIEESDLDPDDPDAVFKINIYLTMAEYEAKKTSKRILFNNKMRIKNKQVIAGNFQFPWVVVGDAKNRHLEKDKEKEEMLYDILEFFETHQSKRATLGYMNVKYGFKMSMSSINNLLTNTLLYGTYKGVPDYVEPYITKERYDHIQEILKRNARIPANPNQVFLFSGLIKCPVCGNNLTGNFQKTNGGKYANFSYRCNGNRTRKICTFSKSTSEGKIEKQLLNNLELYINNEIARVESVTDTTPKNNNHIKLTELNAELDRLNIMFRKGRIKEEEYDKEYLMLQKQIESIDIEAAPPERDLDALKGILETDYKGLYEQLTKENKKAFWRGVIKEFSIDENKKIIEESIIFF